MKDRKDIMLIVDDDRELCGLLIEYLAQAGFVAEAAFDGETGVEMAASGKYGMVVLDVMLPGRYDGFKVLRQIQKRTNIAVLMLTARGDVADRILGLDMGADDYLAKPFDPRELLARIRTILRRTRRSTLPAHAVWETQPCRIGDVEWDAGARRVTCAGKAVDLTAVEFGLLEMLLSKAGGIVTRDELSEAVLERPLYPFDRSIDVHVSKLRKKLGKAPDGAERIQSIRGSGYVYALPTRPVS